MLFHSLLFIFIFLPIVSTLSFIYKNKAETKNFLLLISSIIFYAYWSYKFLVLILVSIYFNWLFLSLLENRRLKDKYINEPVAIGIVVIMNLFILFLFKYASFVLTDILSVDLTNTILENVILPLGISFYTFQQISYLIDYKRNEVGLYSCTHYSLYVLFFPQLIAGPIVRHNELIPQFKNSISEEIYLNRISLGIFIFVVGLIKKVLIAEHLNYISNKMFDTLTVNSEDFINSWLGAISYGLEIFFDFSAYSEMAIGIAMTIGYTLPINFDAPYRSTSVREFWQRWHMTLSRFFRDYLYIPLGGNRNGIFKLFISILTTMTFCGIWHGSGWNYLSWGVVHGLALFVNHVWREHGIKLNFILAWFITFIFVFSTWVIFRNLDPILTLSILKNMFTPSLDIHFQPVSGIDFIDYIFILFSLIIAILMPQVVTFAKRVFKPNFLYALFLACTLVGLVLLVRDSEYKEFIYFIF